MQGKKNIIQYFIDKQGFLKPGWHVSQNSFVTHLS